MGSFANSIHIRCDNPALVIDALHEVMRDRGYEPAGGRSGGNGSADVPAPVRGICVSEAHRGWVSLLDSGLAELQQLAEDLSRRLDCHAIITMVNDSDSWHYVLYRSGRSLDEFDSSTRPPMTFEELGAFAGAFTGGGDPAGFLRFLRDNAGELRDRLEERMTDEIREIDRRARGGESITQDEFDRYTAWFMFALPEVMSEMGDAPDDAGPPTNEAAEAGEDDASASGQHRHVERLETLLIEEAEPEQVRDVLREQATFAEDVLRRFLPLIGIPAVYADLNYLYLQEFTREELERAGVCLPHHLQFQRSGRGGLRLV